MVDKALFQRYEVALLACTDLGRMQVEALVKSVEGLPPQQQAARLMAEYPKILANYGQAAAQATMQWYQDARDAHFADDEEAEDYEAEAASPIQQSWAYEDIQKAATDGLAHLPGIAVNRIMRRADQTMAYNVQHDPARPCWAVVPNFGACGFCVLVGSNGFYMKHEPVKVQRHDHCRCTVVCDFDTKNPHLDGYDPDQLYKAYHEAELSTRAYVDREWERMTPEEQERYKRKGRSAKDVFRTKVISKEIKRRDPTWVQDGHPLPQNYQLSARDKYGKFMSEPDHTRRPNPSDYDQSKFAWVNSGGEWRDLFAHDVLRWNGIWCAARPNEFYGTDGKMIKGASSPDLDFDKSVWGGGYLWEVKSPQAGNARPKKGNELDYIGQALKDSSRNFRNPYDPLTNSPTDDWDGKRRVVLNLRYRPSPASLKDTVDRISYEISKRNIAEVIYIDENGDLHHIMK